MKKKKTIKLIEKSTGYDFLKFWKEFTEQDEEFEEDTGGQFLNWGTKKTLKGLCAISEHYIYQRGNSFYGMKLKELVNYIGKHDKIFYNRTKTKEIPDIEVNKWVDEIFQGNKNLRKQLGLK